jgi:ATP-dependent Lon protease
MSLGGSIVPAANLAASLQWAFDAGAKRILIPMSSVTDISDNSWRVVREVSDEFLCGAVDAVFKALGVE